MRRLCLILLCGLIAVPAAVAASRAAGDGVLELQTVNGNVVVNGARGTIWGQLDKGRLVVSDPIEDDGVVFVTGAERTKERSDTVTVYEGRNIHFRISGKYRLAFYKASGIDLTAVGVGTALLTGDPFAFDAGDYAVDGGKWVPVPPFQRSVQFGVQPSAVGGPVQSP